MINKKVVELMNMSILKSSSWAKPALNLLESINQLDQNLPAVLHIRHTERPPSIRDFDSRLLASTDAGRKAAYEFGSFLPKTSRYTIFHSSIERSRETAEEINKGILNSGGESEVAGMVSYTFVNDPTARLKYVQSQKWFGQDGSYGYACQWIAGLIPLVIQKSSLEFAQKYAEITLNNLKTASPSEIQVYVTHDTFIHPLLFHWFGIPLYTDGIRFLEGFLMQLKEGEINLWVRDRNEVYPYPYWWPKF
jgi:broad specificity phosphatase PhoE